MNLSNSYEDSRYPHATAKQVPSPNPGVSAYSIASIWVEGDGKPYELRSNIARYENRSQKYIEVVVGDSAQSSYTVQREGYKRYGNKPYQKIDYDKSALKYKLVGLMPAMIYRAMIVAYHEGGGTWKQNIKVNNEAVGQISYGDCKPETLYIDIPKSSYKSGKIDLTVSKLIGNHATLGALAVYEYEMEGGKSGGFQNESNPKTATEIFSYQLLQNAPNPTKGRAIISYQLAGPQHVRLKIYNTIGQLVKTLVDEPQAPGCHSRVWNGRDDKGHLVTSGVYFYRLDAGQYSNLKRMILIK